MVKEKLNSIRTYYADGLRKRAACLCIRESHPTEILLVSGSKHPDRWVVPGGGVEPAENTRCAALREAMEEAGVAGDLGSCIGVFENRERMTRTSVYILTVTEMHEDWDDARTLGRKREWFQIADAEAHLASHKPVQQSYLNIIKQHPSFIQLATPT